MSKPNVANHINSVLNIRIDVNKENNVIFLKCEGFRTEVFMPTIIEGHLSLINVVPQRRCACFSTSHICMKNPKQMPIRGIQKLISKQGGSNFDMSSPRTRYQFYTSTPEKSNFIESLPHENVQVFEKSVKNSTVPHQSVVQTSSNSLQIINDVIVDNSNEFEPNTLCRKERELREHTSQRLPTPEPMRKIVAANNTNSHEMHFRSMPNETKSLNNGVSLEHLHSNTISSALISPHSQSQDFNILVDCFSSMEYPRTPSPKEISNNQAFASKSYLQTPSTINSQWRKVLTPIRTYSRLQYSPNQTISTTVSSSTKSTCTVGVKAQVKVVKMYRQKITKCNEKLSISPRSFKQQLQTKPVAEPCQALRAEFSKRHFEENKKSAFQLFTTPTMQSQCFASKLLAMFHTRCTHKGSSTYPKYKKLARKEKRSICKSVEVTPSAEIISKPINSPVSEYSIIILEE